jgi:hypothetical protein
MWEVTSAIALAVFLTCTLFFIIYGFAYLGIMTIARLVLKIKKRYWELKNGKD